MTLVEVFDELHLRATLTTRQQQYWAAQALESTLDEKMAKSGSLETLTDKLKQIVDWFSKHQPLNTNGQPVNIGLDDLRYRLAHLYMRARNWEDALDQLTEIGQSGDSFWAHEVDLYTSVCAVRSKEFTQEQIEVTIRGGIQKLASSKRFKSKSVQEQFHDLYEILVYTAGLDHNLLRPYYEKKTTLADIEIRTDEHAQWCPVSRYRLQKIIETSERMLALNNSDSKGQDVLRGLASDFQRVERAEKVKKLAVVLARAACENDVRGVEKEELAEQIGIRIRQGKNTDLSRLVGFLRAYCGSEDAVTIEYTHAESSPIYKLKYPFLLARRREGREPPSPSRLISRM